MPTFRGPFDSLRSLRVTGVLLLSRGRSEYRERVATLHQIPSMGMRLSSFGGGKSIVPPIREQSLTELAASWWVRTRGPRTTFYPSPAAGAPADKVLRSPFGVAGKHWSGQTNLVYGYLAGSQGICRAAHTSSSTLFWPPPMRLSSENQVLFRSAPSGTTPVSRYLHSAINSFRANATIPTRRDRLLPAPNRSSNHRLSWLCG